MKTNNWLVLGLVITLPVSVQTQAQTIDIDTLDQNMVAACPAVWEDIKSEIDPAAVSGDVWNGDTTDKDTFKTFLAAMMGASAPDSAGLETMASDPSTVASECATQRIALLDALLSRLPRDALQAMNSVLDQLGLAALAIEGGGWQIGDVRITGRPEPVPGWLFMNGQTIGGPGSDAQLSGEVLETLFELAKTWFPNTGDEIWTNGDIVILPHNVQPSVDFQGELKFADGDGDLAINALSDGTLGAQQSTVAASCKAIKAAQPDALSGLYWLDVNGGATSDAYQAYCDMSAEGGGWTLVVTQYEQDPVTNWNEGIQADYDPTLATDSGFALNASQLPLHTEVAFGKDLQPTYVDYVDFVYSTDPIAEAIVTGKKTGRNYHLVRYDATGGQKYCDPDRAENPFDEWANTLILDVVGEQSYAWCLAASQKNILDSKNERIGAGMLGDLSYSDETFAWTVWVR